MRLVAANWKMNPQTIEEARKLAARVEHGQLGTHRHVETAICPPFVFLPALKHTIHHVKIGAQNVSAEEKGPHTGEVSAVMLEHLGIKYVIVGHSERRALGEDDEFINHKMKLAKDHKLHPILCVGFGTTKSMASSRVKTIISKQLKAGLAGLKFEKNFLTIAYEPVWAISKGPGTAVTVAPEHAAEITGYIKEKQPESRGLYGGSITSRNVDELSVYNEIEGGLVGGASLDAAEFLKIIKSFAKET